VAVFPVFYISNGSLVARIENDLGRDIDNHQWAEGYGGRDIADRRPMIILMRNIKSMLPVLCGRHRRHAARAADIAYRIIFRLIRRITAKAAATSSGEKPCSRRFCRRRTTILRELNKARPLSVRNTST